jgi:uncharacterized protein YbaP (TraB family)
MRRLLAALCLALSAAPAHAVCTGADMIAALPEAERAALEAAADAVPFARGNLWQATREGQTVTLVGTYHLDDPRLAPLVQAVRPALDGATRLLVEAGPEEEAALKARIAAEPSLIVNTDGPTLPESLPPEIWQRLSEAMAERGIPGFMAAKFRPWYLSMMLSVPPCALAEMTEPNGLDRQLIDLALTRGLPVQALEPYDTALHIFDELPQEDQLSMIISSLAMEERSEDMSATLTARYFDGQSRLIWEFMRAETLKLPGYTPEQVEREFATMEEAMMNARNRSWIPVIEAAAAEGPVLAAFGALHLAGDEGVLNLLAQKGWTITPLDAP